jgi:iron complex outermembrane receptor protein
MTNSHTAPSVNSGLIRLAISLRPIPIRLLSVSLLVSAGIVSAQDALNNPRQPEVPAEGPYRSPTELKKLPLESLVDVEITSASRRPEPISQASSAVDVITGDEIERAGATNIPDALRLGTELQVAQIDGHTWGISARGFNISAANKMQVLMDGRSLYTPLFSGVFWDVQQTFLADLAQIEIIRGPGATLWGANAVNGVINIISKSAKDTQGLLIEGGGGIELEGFGGARYGGAIAKDTYYRAYVMHQSRDSLNLEGDGSGRDGTDFTQGGFRIDSEINSEDTLTLQGDAYSGGFGQLNAPDITVDGENVIGRWTRQADKDASLMVQAYFDRTHRLIPTVFREDRNTFDMEVQSRFVIGEHDLLVGGNYRLSHDDIGNLGPTLAFIPDSEMVHLVSGYFQEEWHVVPDKFSLTAGTKLEYNSFSGFEYQPTARFTWILPEEQTIWGAVSRAVRTPTRVDQNFVAPNPTNGGPPLLVANPDFESEVLIAYELGYRIKRSDAISIDIAAYYNDYSNLRSVEPIGPNPFPVTLGNKLEGSSYGGAVTVKWHVANWWQINGGVSALSMDLHRSAGSRDTSNGASEGNDPNWSVVAHSMLDLPHHLKFDTVLRYVGELPNPPTPSYFTVDLRLAWSPIKNLEFAVVGRDLLDEAHPEFRQTALTREVGRTVFATFKWTY